MIATKRQSNVPVPVLLPAPSTTPLDDALFKMLSRVATAPVRCADQGGDGAINRDGLDTATLRRIARRWCARMTEEKRFDFDELEGLDLALEHFSDQEFLAMVRGAVHVHMP